MTEPLVLVPTFMADARMFWPQIMSLGQDRTICLPPISAASSIGSMASVVLHGAPTRFALAGHGLGGMVALEVLRRAPERVSRLALISTTCLAETPQAAAAREPHIVTVQAGRLNDVMHEILTPRILAPGPRRRDILALAMEMAQDLGVDAFVAQSRALQRRAEQQKTLMACMMPTLVLCGAHDPLYPVQRQEVMAEMVPEAQFVVLPDAGHFSTLEQPDAVTGALREWLATPLLLR